MDIHDPTGVETLLSERRWPDLMISREAEEKSMVKTNLNLSLLGAELGYGVQVLDH